MLAFSHKTVSHTLSSAQGRRRDFVEQRVQLSGAGTRSFEHAVAALRTLHLVFARSIPPGHVLEPWQPQSCHLMSALRFATRYLTRIQDAARSEMLPPGKLIDPNGDLLKLTEDRRYVYTVDNEVFYCVATVDEDGKR